jgi:hypothetical protein
MDTNNRLDAAIQRVMNKKSFLSGDKFENFLTSELIAIADKAPLLERARAIFWLAKRCDRDEKIIPQVIRPLRKII